MQIIFTKHAKEQMNIRGISELQVQKCIDNPDQKDEQNAPIVIFKKLKSPYVYIVITHYSKNSFRIITVYRSSKIKKYLNF